MKTLYVLFDAECAFCLRCRRWLMQQAAFVELKFIAKQSPEAECRFPGIGRHIVTGDLVVVSDAGAVYTGPNAFIMCLYALVEYREWSLRLTHPALLPFARKALDLISRNRDAFSQLLRVWNNVQLAKILDETLLPNCENTSLKCSANAGEEAKKMRRE